MPRHYDEEKARLVDCVTWPDNVSLIGPTGVSHWIVINAIMGFDDVRPNTCKLNVLYNRSHITDVCNYT